MKTILIGALVIAGILVALFCLFGEGLGADLQEIFFPLVAKSPLLTPTSAPTPTAQSTPTMRPLDFPTPAPTLCIPSYWGDCINTPTPHVICLPEPCDD